MRKPGFVLCLLLAGWSLFAAAAAEDIADVARVAIFKDDIPPLGAPASPDHLARLLAGPAFNTAFLNSDQLADARSLEKRDDFSLLVSTRVFRARVALADDAAVNTVFTSPDQGNETMHFVLTVTDDDGAIDLP